MGSYNSFVYDDSLMINPVSSWDFVPEIVLPKKPSSGEFFMWGKEGIPKGWGNKLNFDQCPICCSKRSVPIQLENPFDYIEYKLSKYLENSQRIVEYLVVWKEGDIGMEFIVKHGNSKAEDKDGFIQAKLVANNDEFELIGDTKFEVRIGSTINLTLKVKKIVPNSNNEFDLKTLPSIEFYASDNSSDWFDFEGNITEEILVGKFAIIPYQCINYDWTNSGKFIKDEDFVVYTKDCLIAATEQINKANYKTAYGGYSEDHKYAYLIYKDNEGRISNTSYQDIKDNNIHENDEKPKAPVIYKNSFLEAVKYLKEAMQASVPVIAGTDHSAGTKSYNSGGGDSTSDHFIVLVGMGQDVKEESTSSSICYFYFFDNAVSGGYNDRNKIYSNCLDYTLTAGNTNIFISGSSTYKKYYITQIRKSVKIK